MISNPSIRRRGVLALISLGCSLMFRTEAAQSQSRLGPEIKAPAQQSYINVYQRTLQIIFRPESQSYPRDTVLKFSVLFEPGSDPELGGESQIEVVIPLDGNATLEWVTAKHRVTSVFEELLKVQSDVRAEDVARKVDLRRETFRISTVDALRFYKGLSEAVSQRTSLISSQVKSARGKGSVEVALDVSAYDIQYSSGGLEVKVFEASGKGPIADWARKFRADISSNRFGR